MCFFFLLAGAKVTHFYTLLKIFLPFFLIFFSSLWFLGFCTLSVFTFSPSFALLSSLCAAFIPGFMFWFWFLQRVRRSILFGEVLELLYKNRFRGGCGRNSDIFLKKSPNYSSGLHFFLKKSSNYSSGLHFFRKKSSRQVFEEFVSEAYYMEYLIYRTLYYIV